MTADRSRLLLAAVAIAAASASLAPGARAFAVAGSQDAVLTARQVHPRYKRGQRAPGPPVRPQPVYPRQCTAWCQLVYVSW